MAIFEQKKTFYDIFTNTNDDSIRVVKINNPNRPLTPGEVQLAQSVYRKNIDCSKVKIYLGSYFPLDTQDIDTFLTPNGSIYVMEKLYKQDYSVEDDLFKKIFIHEMAHVWQHQKKLQVLPKAAAVHACAILKNYDANNYNIFEKKHYPSNVMPNLVETLPKKLVDYNLEQQAEIFSDYWLLNLSKRKDRDLMRENNSHNIKNYTLMDIASFYKTKIDEALA